MAKRERAFTLLEMMAVVMIMLILLGVAGLTFANARPSVKVKKDAAQMVAFLRNMWDHTKATGAPLVLSPNYETGELSYTDPRIAKTSRAKFSSDAKIIGIKLNDRLYTAASYDLVPEEESGTMDESGRFALYVSEGRGLTQVGVLFGIPREEHYDYLTFCSLNLITGRGTILSLNEDDLQELLHAAEEAVYEEESQ